MDSKMKSALGLLRMFGVKTQGLETLLDTFEGKPPSAENNAARDQASAAVNAPYWDGEPETYFLAGPDGRRLTRETFAAVSDFEEGLAVIERQKDKGGKNGYIDPQGRFPFEPIYEMAQVFSNGLGAVRLDGKWGFVDRAGRTAVPFDYEEAARFDFREKGLAQVRKGGKWFFIDKSGNFVRDCEAPK